ncbi:MAG: diguanylate cyclase domain-containing protein [Oscillospiraceae bacterium]
MENKSLYKRLYIVLSVLVMMILFLSLNAIVEKQNSQIMRDAEYTISRETKQICGSIENSVGYAINSIQVTAAEISKHMDGEELENPHEAIGEHLTNTPFSSIEYIRADGMNITDAGEPFDASGREYYVNGMAGKTGIWVNFAPKYSNEPLLNFYTPLYFNEKIVGVITGTLGGNSTISSLLGSDFLGQEMTGVLVDSENRIISCTHDFEAGAYLVPADVSLDMADNEDISLVFDAQTDVSLRIKCGSSCAVGAVVVMPTTGWRIIEVIPAENLDAVMANINFFIYIMLAIVFVTFLLYFVFILRMNYLNSSKDIRKANEEREEQFNILKSMSDIYYSMHLLNLTENTVLEYSSRNEVKEIVNKQEDAAAQMQEIMKATVEEQYLDRVLEFTDLTSLAERMRGKKNLSMEFVAKNYGWFRCVFIAIDTDKQTGLPTKVVFTTEIIDEDKRREEELRLQSSTDGLTGLFNRRAYIEDIANLTAVGTDSSLVYIAVDINGLKAMNDTHGHEAGDELIKGAAGCITNAFGPLGKIYRTGGDELVAIIHTDKQSLDEINARFNAAVEAWHGEKAESLSVSSGYACAEEFPEAPISELANIADKRMYEAKRRYYMSKGIDRRNN